MKNRLGFTLVLALVAPVALANTSATKSKDMSNPSTDTSRNTTGTSASSSRNATGTSADTTRNTTDTSASTSSTSSGSTASNMSGDTSGSTSKAVKPTQAEILRKIHLTNQTEIKVGQLAKEKGQAQSVKDFGDKLVKDHQKADEKVYQTADALKLDVNSPVASVDNRLQPKEKALMDKLQSASGTEFDRVFASEMDKAHSDTIKDLEDARSELKNTKTAALIDELLPTLHSHADAAEGLPRKAE